MLEKDKSEILLELQDKEQRIRKMEEKIDNICTGVFSQDKSSICKLFFEHSKDGYILIENKKIIECNNSAVKMFGYETKKELLGLKVIDLFFEKLIRAKAYSDNRHVRIDEDFLDRKHIFEWSILRKNDTQLPVEVSITKIPIDGKIILCAALRVMGERKQAERVVKRKEQLCQKIFEKNHCVTLLIDPINGKILDANRSASYFYGYSKEELMNMNITKLNILNNDERILKVIKTAIEGEKNQFFLNQRLANGEIKFVEVHCNQVSCDGKDLIFFVVHDLSDMKKILNALEESEKKYKELFNRSKDAIYLYKIDKDGIPNKFMEVNDITCKRLGYSREELLDMTIKDIKTVEDEKSIYKKLNKIVEDGHGTYESTHLSKYGGQIPVEITSHKFQLFGNEVILSSARDITRRKWVEKFLRESEERNRRLVELLPDPIILQKDAKILYINNAAIKFLGGGNRHNFIGRNILDFIDVQPNENRVVLQKKLEDVTSEFSPFHELKIIRKKDNAVLDVEIASTVFNYSNKRATLILLRDISDRRKAEKYIKLFNEAIEYDKLKTQFFANLSHELRTPLNVILGTIQIMNLYLKERSLQNVEELMENRLKVLKQNCYRLLRLVNNLIDITKIDAGFYEVELHNHNIVNIVEEITLSVAEYAKQKKITLVFDTDVEEKIIACDPDKIERIMLNLLSNAIKFTEPEGLILVNIFNKKKGVIISVKDTGIGIPSDETKFIFENFRQVDKSFTRNHEGSGIGLSLAKSLVEMHNGTIEVNSEYGEGSEFIIELPTSNLAIDDNMMKENCENELKSKLIEIISIEFSDIYS